MAEWTSVKDKLPERRDDYLVCTEDAEVYVCEYIPSVEQWWHEDDLICDGRITHWMYLPDPPKEASSAGAAGTGERWTSAVPIT